MNATAKTVATYAASGMNDEEIAAKMGITVRRAFEIRRDNKIKSPVVAEAERKRAEIAHFYGCGLTDDEIALTAGIDSSTVRRERRKMGLKPNKSFVPREMPPRIRRERRAEAARKYHAKRLAEQGKVPRKKAAPKPKPKPKPAAAAPAPKPKLHDQIRPIRAAIGGVFDREPAADVQGAVAVAMSRLHTDPAFARAWMEAGR